MLARSLKRTRALSITGKLSALCAFGSIPRRKISAYIDGERYIVVQEQCEEAKPLKFPGVWLRDNCKCEKCFHASSQSRRIDWDNFDVDIRPLTVRSNKATKQLQVEWSDKHKSTFDLDWLKEREFHENRQQSYIEDFYRPKTAHWKGVEFPQILQTFDFEDVIHEDEVLRQWLQALSVRGVALIKNSPIDKSVVRRLAERVGFVRRTTYGEEFIVKAKPGAKNYAYLSDPLPLHTDLPYYEYKPGVNLLHCMVQTASNGGDNLLVDGFHLADVLREQYPKDFKILTETIIDWNDIGSENGYTFHNIWRAPVICLDKNGNYSRINHSVPQRDSHFSVPLEQVIPWYRANARFAKMARLDAFPFKTQPGDVLTFNNIRLLHGRCGYDDTNQNVRYVVGVYMDWDIIYSKLRVLKLKQNQKT